MGTLIKSVDKMMDTLQEMRDTQKVHEATLATTTYVDEKITDARERMDIKIESAKRRTRVQTWLTGTLSASFGALLAYLINFWLTH